MMQLPPPVHGASVMNSYVASSESLASQFDMDVMPLQFSASIDDVGRVSLRKMASAFRHSLTLLSRVVRRRPDLAYFTISPVGGAFYRDCVFVAILKTFRIRRIFHLHGKGIGKQLESRWKRPLYKWAFSGAWLIHLSPLLAGETASLIDPSRLRFVPNGIQERGQPAAVARATSVPRILYLSNMAEDKGPLVLLDALGVLAARGVQFEANFVGATYRDAVAKFHVRMEELRLSHRVRYLGPVYGDAKDALFDAHDIFVFPTFYAQEAFPLVLLEAMQKALPIVTTFEGAIPAIVEDGVTGYLVPQRDATALADRLEQLVADSELRARMGEAGRKRYADHFTLAHFEKALCAALLEAALA